MQLILKEDVDHLGKRGQVVDVAAGYARNFLLPKKLAMKVSDDNLRHVQKQAKVHSQKIASEKAEAEALGARVSGVRLVFARKIHEGDEGAELYGSVSAGDIADALETKGYAIEKRRVQLDEAIKKLGEYEVSVKLHPEVAVQIKVTVEKEEG